MAGARFLQVGVLYWKTQKVQDALVLCACADMTSHLVPVISVELKTLAGEGGEEKEEREKGGGVGSEGGKWCVCV